MKLIRKQQQGGAMAAEDPNAVASQAPMNNGMGEQDPMMTIVQLFSDGLSQQNCEMLAQGAQMFLQLVQEAQSAESAGQPVFGKGGKIVSRTQHTLQLVRK